MEIEELIFPTDWKRGCGKGCLQHFQASCSELQAPLQSSVPLEGGWTLLIGMVQVIQELNQQTVLEGRMVTTHWSLDQNGTDLNCLRFVNVLETKWKTTAEAWKVAPVWKMPANLAFAEWNEAWFAGNQLFLALHSDALDLVNSNGMLDLAPRRPKHPEGSQLHSGIAILALLVGKTQHAEEMKAC